MPERPFRIGEITIQPDLGRASVADVSLELTAREFQMLVLLAQAQGPLRREDIYERVWGQTSSDNDRSVEVFIWRLRRKLGRASPGWDYIRTHPGISYECAPTPTPDEPAQG
jgi:DNA-binding response OmpR family regulator